MNLLNPILAELFTAELRKQIQGAGATPSFKTDELALWHADRQASSSPQTRPPRVLKIGPFNRWFHRSQEKRRPCQGATHGSH
jgi:hypothetical protein|uniref:Uncharacterized protein n=1 Tax=Meiothermus ruber TaxID=277 RepID=A0A7C3HS30_MEIRU